MEVIKKICVLFKKDPILSGYKRSTLTLKKKIENTLSVTINTSSSMQ